MELKKYHILLIEDNPGDARLIQEYLDESRSLLFIMEVVERLSAGIKRLKSSGIDLVLLDLHLPDSSGFETFTRLYAQYPQIPIIILSGNNDETLALEAVSQGAQDYLEKGIYDGGLLVRAIRYAIERKRAEEKLREHQEFLRNVIDTDPNMIYVKDSSGRFTLINKVTSEHFGLSVAEMTGKLQSELGEGAEISTRFMNEDRRVLQSLKTKRALEKTLDNQGKVRWFQTVRTPILSPDGKDYQVMCIANDITEQKNAEEQLLLSLDKLNQLFKKTVESMAMTIEIRDPYTAGHQRRVALLAKAIAEKMGLDAEQVSGVGMASIIHDIGKIGVPAEILSKPGRISDLEFELIKIHSQIGFEVLKSIEFAWPIAEVVMQHHERLDGTGYPRRLKGDDILLEARIISVADVVEAMSTHRPYRPALGIQKALGEIRQRKGKAYDPKVVEVCLALFKDDHFTFDDTSLSK